MRDTSMEPVGVGRRAFCALGASWAALAFAPSLHAAERLRGRVRHAITGAALAGVGVSNGFDIVESGTDGSFEIAAADDLPFVFVNVPAGLAPDPRFYVEAGSGILDFRLMPVPSRSQSRIRVAHLTDSHIGVAEHPHYVAPDELADDFRRVVADAAPDLIIVTGDLVDQGRRRDLEAYREATNAAGSVPVVSLFAAHDALVEWREAKPGAIVGHDYRSVLGPQWFSFDWGVWHFVMFPELNAEPPARRNRRRLDRWVEIDLARVRSDRLVAVVTHDPPRWHPNVGTYFTGPRIEQFSGHPGFRLVLHGQYHSTRVVQHGQVTVVGTPSIGMGGIDTSPRGYSLVELDESGVLSVENRPMRQARSKRAAPNVASGWRGHLPSGAHRADIACADGLFIFCLDDRPNPLSTGLIALDAATGAVRWRAEMDSTLKGGVAVAPNDHARAAGRAFVVSVAGRLTCFETSTGRSVWTKELPNYPDRWIFSRPVLTADAVVVAQYSGFAAFDLTDGDLRWTDGPQWEDGWSPVHQVPALSGDMIVFLTTKSLGNYAASARHADSGELLWMRRLDRPMTPERPRLYQLAYASPAVTNRRVIVSGLAERLVALDVATGETAWDVPSLRFDGDGAGVQPGAYLSVFEHAAAIVVDDDTAYISMTNGRICAVAVADGRRLWDFHTRRVPLVDVLPYFRGRGNMLTAVCVIGRNMTFGGADGFLYTLDRSTGTLVHEEELGEAITVPPVAAGGGTLVATLRGDVSWRPHHGSSDKSERPQEERS